MTHVDGKDWFRSAAFASYVLTITLFFVSSFYPQARLWGLNWYAYFDVTGRVFLLTAGSFAGLIVWWLTKGERAQSKDQAKSDRVYLIVSVTLVALLTALFCYLRVRTHFLGDGYLLLAKLQDAVSFAQPWQAGPFAVQSWLYNEFGRSDPDGALFVFRFISVGCGIALLSATAIATRYLFKSLSDRLLFLLGVCTGGYLLLFFGYVENYPLFVLSVSLFSLIGLLSVKGLISRWVILIPLAMSATFHPFGVSLLPASLFILMTDTAIARYVNDLPRNVKILCSAILLLALTALFFYLYTTNFALRHALVPVLNNRFTVEGYSMFSWKHLVDYLNLLVLLLPACILSLAVVFRFPLRELWNKSSYRFLITMLIPSLLLVFLIEPKLGMPRDWDLFSFAGVPLVVTLFYALVDSRSKIQGSTAAGMLAIVLGLLVLAPRVGTQVVSRVSIDLFDNLAELDRLRNRSVQDVVFLYFERRGDFAEAERRRAEYRAEFPDVGWVEQASDLASIGMQDSAAILYRKVIEYNPSHSIAWSNLGISYFNNKQYDSALAYLKVSDGIYPLNWSTYNHLGATYNVLGEQEIAERYWMRALELDPNNVKSREHLLSLYQSQGRLKEYLNLQFEIFKMAQSEDAPLEYIQMMGDLYISQGLFGEAAVSYERALERGLDSSIVLKKQEEYPQLRVIE